jgi:hypothetical protein
MTVAKQLYQLQEIDMEIQSDEQALAQMASQLGEGQIVVEARTELASEQKRLKELGQQQRFSEGEVDGLSSKIAKLEHELYGGQVKNPKELANLQRDVDGLKARRVQLEDQALGLMEQVEAAEASVADKGGELKMLEVEWSNQQQRLSAYIDRLETALSGLKHKRQLMTDGIDRMTVEFYQELRGHKGQAVAKVEQGRCRGCRILLPTTELQQARSGELAQCGSCGRIVFIA